ncbi:MAG: DNA recombination protein RmuC [Prevotella sp.]|jgi:DNA recombination protein RmuC|nr:DNA recombination protein RmuC [Prevotella sp.]
MEIILVIVGFILGCVAGYFLATRSQSEIKMEAERTHTQLKILQQQRTADMENARNQREELKSMYEKQLQDQRTLFQKQFSDLREQQEKQFSEQLESAKQGMDIAARKVMEENSKALKEANMEHVGHITAPLQTAISDMRKALNDTSIKTAEGQASLREIIDQMRKSNQEIGDKADSLVNVLRRDNKVTGNWGEVILGDLLDSQGLVEGKEYDVQTHLRDANGNIIRNDSTGAQMIPDVILHYPQGEDAIIDSKVSLVAFEKYVNASTPEEKDLYMKEHVDSVRKHVNELARKDYSKYVKTPRETVDFVIMFMPVEASLQLALVNDTHLWDEAFQKKVFMTSEQNLTAILHMIRVAWVQNTQAENQQKVFGLAETLLDRLGDFFQRYNKLGELIKKSQEAYDSADNKLISGQQSVVKKARELVDLGAKENPNRPIPELKDSPGDNLLEKK